MGIQPGFVFAEEQAALHCPSRTPDFEGTVHRHTEEQAAIHCPSRTLILRDCSPAYWEAYGRFEMGRLTAVQ